MLPWTNICMESFYESLSSKDETIKYDEEATGNISRQLTSHRGAEVVIYFYFPIATEAGNFLSWRTTLATF